MRTSSLRISSQQSSSSKKEWLSSPFTSSPIGHSNILSFKSIPSTIPDSSKAQLAAEDLAIHNKMFPHFGTWFTWILPPWLYPVKKAHNFNILPFFNRGLSFADPQENLVCPWLIFSMLWKGIQVTGMRGKCLREHVFTGTCPIAKLFCQIPLGNCKQIHISKCSSLSYS